MVNKAVVKDKSVFIQKSDSVPETLDVDQKDEKNRYDAQIR